MSDEVDEMSVASLGSQPAAWAAFESDSGESGIASLKRAPVEKVANRMGWRVVPLYRQPAITDAEREHVGVVADWAAEHLGQDDPGVVALLAWLGRKKLDSTKEAANMSDAEWIPCGERQPDYEVPVLAWADGYAFVAMLRCDEHGDFWDDFNEGSEIDPACITHWMPITPPTGSK